MFFSKWLNSTFACAVLAFLAHSSISFAAEQTVDPVTPLTLDPDFKFAVGRIVPWSVTDLLLAPDGGLIFGGDNLSPPIGRLAENGSRLTPTDFGGSLDANMLFFSREGALIAGGKSPTMALIKLPPEGADPYFVQRAQLSGNIKAVLATTSDDIIAAGQIGLPLNTNRYGLIRLKRTGVIETNFNRGSTLGLDFGTAAVVGGNQILGSFTFTNSAGQTDWGFGRWLESGAGDTNYDASWIPANAHVALIQPGPKDVLYAVIEETVGEELLSRLVTLDAQGNSAPEGTPWPPIYGQVHALAFGLDPDHPEILIGGVFTKIGETPCNNFAWLAPDGTVAWYFEPGRGPNLGVRAIQMLLDGRVVLGGAFTSFDGGQAGGLVRLLGRSALGRSYVYWANSEFRAFEKVQQTALTLRRSGPVDADLTLELSASSPNVVYPSNVRFAPGERELTIPVNFPDNVSADNRMPIIFHLATDASGDLFISRPDCDLIILDDETSGTLDPNFISPVDFKPTAMARQADGKTLIAYWENGPKLVRMNNDRSLDTNFVTNGVPATNTCCAQILQIEVASDSKIYVAGTFVSSGSYGTNLIARLNADGSLDTNFNPRISAGLLPTQPLQFALQPDGSVLVAQSWAEKRFKISGPANNFAQPLRLTPDGSRDGLFAVAIELNVYDMVVHPDGTVFVAGTPRLSFAPGIYRFSSRGVLDTNFVLRADGRINQIELDKDNHLIAAGDFHSINGVNGSVARIRASDGTVQPPFITDLDGQIDRMILRDDGKIYIAGTFTRVGGLDRYRLARLNADASLDKTYDPGLGFSSSPVLALQQDGELLAGIAGIVDLLPATGVVRLEDSERGTLRIIGDRLSVPETKSVASIQIGRSGGSAGVLKAVLSIVDPRISLTTAVTNLIVTFSDGEFGTKLFEFPVERDPEHPGDRPLLVRFLDESSTLLMEHTLVIRDPISALDATFRFEGPTGTNAVRDFALTSDGSVYVAGKFDSLNDHSATNLARLTPGLTVDTNFALSSPPRSLSAGTIEAIALRSKGEIIVGGYFSRAGTNEAFNLAQFYDDGSLDLSFTSSNRFFGWGSNPVNGLFLQNEGKLLVRQSSDLRRLQSNGVRDPSFNQRTVGSSSDMVVDTSDSIYVFGYGAMTKLSNNGKLETNFSVLPKVKPLKPQPAFINCVSFEANGNLLIGGYFTDVNDFSSARIARISPDGIVDTNFVAKLGTNGLTGITSNSISAIQVLPDGDILVGGNFQSIAGEPQSKLARLSPTGELRDYFRPQLLGDSIDEFLLLPSGDILARGTITNFDGSDVGLVFKLHLPENLAPAVTVRTPTNGTVYQVSDAMGSFDITVEAYDPDGFLDNTIVYLDEEPLATNSLSRFTTSAYWPSAVGNHEIRVVSTDSNGARTTNRTAISVTQSSGSLFTEIAQSEGGVTINFDGQLQSSLDLIHWVDEPASSPFQVGAPGERKFYRTRR